ncbi:MAG: hypothetical protein CMO55_13800 [Verrucomicrobiales bacterium]|nr:hypothetical protein [Verrucomicrobiales bacterium]
MKNVGTTVRFEEIEFFLRLRGLWVGITSLPPPPDPPFDIERMEPLNVPIHRNWSGQTDPPPEDWWQDTPGEWYAPELPLDDDYTLVLDGDEPHDLADFPTFSVCRREILPCSERQLPGKAAALLCPDPPDFSTAPHHFRAAQ